MGIEDEEHIVSDPVTGTNYKPMNPRYVANNTNNTWT